jgi:hypothetical protein
LYPFVEGLVLGVESLDRIIRRPAGLVSTVEKDELGIVAERLAEILGLIPHDGRVRAIAVETQHAQRSL